MSTSLNPAKAALLLALATPGLGCWQPDLRPPPVAPTKDMPPVRADFPPLPPSRQWVVLDTPGDPARVTRRVEGASTSDGDSVYREVCVTPCVVDLKYGKQTLSFVSTPKQDRSSTLTLQVGDDPLIVRHVMPDGRPKSLVGGVFVALGLVAAPIGGIMTPVGFAKHDQALQVGGLVTLGLGALFVAVGLPVAYAGRGWRVPGATTWWTIPRGGTTPSSVETPAP